MTSSFGDLHIILVVMTATDTIFPIERVKAASVNPVDIKVRGGVYDDYPGTDS